LIPSSRLYPGIEMGWSSLIDKKLENGHARLVLVDGIPGPILIGVRMLLTWI